MTYTICLFGDSVSKGVIFDNLRQKYTHLKNNFASLIQAKDYMRVTNYAKFGCTIEKGQEILLRHLPDVNQYHYIALEFGGNDCDYDWHAISQSPDSPHEPHTPLDCFTDIYRDMLRAIREHGGTPVLLSLPPIDAPRYFNWISRGENREHILHWLGDVEHIYRWHELYNLAVCRLGREENVPVIDISSRFLSEPHYQKLICEDGIHPNEQGHLLIYEAIHQYATQHLPQSKSSPHLATA